MALFNRRMRKASYLLLVSIVVFIALEAIAMALYPGGTWENRSTVGHDFFRNFFCDVASSKALNGQPNPGGIFGKAAMFVLTLGFIPFWMLVSSFLRQFRAGLSKAILALGTLSSAASALVPFVSSQQFGNLHPLLIFLAGVPGILAGGLSTYGLVKAKSGSRIPARLAVLTVILVALDGILYAVNVVTGFEIHPAVLPGLQKVGAISLVAWMASATIFGKRKR